MAVDSVYETGDIYLFDEINDDTSMTIVQSINYLSEMGKVKEIKLHINSCGGCVFGTLAIIDAINFSSIPVTTIGYGQVASGGFLIFISGHNKWITKNSRYMWHDMAYGYYGKKEQHQEFLAESNNIAKQLNDIVTDKTTLTEEDLIQLNSMKYDKWYNANEMLAIIRDVPVEEQEDQPKTFLEKLKFW